MNFGAALLPFSTATLATPELALVRGVKPAPAAGIPAGPALPFGTVEQTQFAGVLALAIQPKDDRVKETKASDDSKDVVADDRAPAPTTAPTAPDLTSITSTLGASMIVRDLGALQPEFRAKVERVISRMNDEYGHTVTVAETYRSQVRQDQLLQQGRTTSGPIVTWTSHSLHTQGRAADLVVDGKWNNPEGYQRLQTIASQEGLSTLGPRDPGHVELREDALSTIANMAQITEIAVSPSVAQPVPKPVAVATSAVVAAPIAAPAPPAPLAPKPVVLVARVAEVAPVAPVAQVAQVAQVAHIAQVAHGSPALPQARTAPAPRIPQSAPATVAAPQERAPSDGSSDHRERHRDAVVIEPVDSPAASPEVSVSSQQSAASTQQVAIPSVNLATAPIPAPIADTGTVARAAAILAMQDAKDAQPVSHMLLKFDNGEGGLDRIRVGLRGDAVGATIDMHNPAAATEAAANIHQLATALQSRGLDSDSLRVRVAGTGSTNPSADLARMVAAGGETSAPALGTLFAQASASSSRSRGDQQGQRPQQDPRQRARKDQQGEQQ